MSELENVRLGGTCPYPGCIEPAGHVSTHPGERMNKRIKKLAAPTEEETRIADLEVENARLQAEEAEAERKTYWECYQRAVAVYRYMKGRDDRYKALAERRKEALDAWGRYSLSSKPSKELLVEALRLTDAAEAPR